MSIIMVKVIVIVSGIFQDHGNYIRSHKFDKGIIAIIYIYLVVGQDSFNRIYS